MGEQVGKVFKHRQLKKLLDPKQEKLKRIYIIGIVAMCVPNYFHKLHSDYSFKDWSHAFEMEIIAVFEVMLFVVLLIICILILRIIFNYFTTEEIGVTPKEVYRKTRLFHQKVSLSHIRLVKNNSSIDPYSWLIIKTDNNEYRWGKTFYSNEVDEIVAYIIEQIRIYCPEKYEDVRTEHFEIEKFWRK